MSRDIVAAPGSPAPIGPYSRAVWAGDLLYLSGQTPVDPATGQLVTGDITVQTHQAFNNLESVLKDAELTMDHVVKVNVYLTTMAHFQAMNAAYESRFRAPFPARTTVAVAELPLGASVEIELVARR